MKKSSKLIHIVDWFPTILGFSNISAPDGLDGLNQKNLFLDENTEPIRKNFIYAWQDKFVANNSTEHFDWSIPDFLNGGKYTNCSV